MTTALRRGLAALLVLATVVFLAGVLTEHATAHAETPAASNPQTGPVSHGDADNGVEPGSSSTAPGGQPSSTTAASTPETVLGLPTETPGLVIGAVISSLGAAAIVLRSRRRLVLAATASLAFGFVVFDCAELARQAGESRTTLVALAGVTKTLHIVATVGVLFLLSTVVRRRAASDA